MPVDPSALRDLFRRASDLPSRDREQFISELTPEIRSELESLLALDHGAATFFDGIVATAQPPLSNERQRFGPYETRELIGRGGMGAVYRAERVDGEFTQTVALKVIERAWLDPRAVDRFRQERQFLAGLVHPNIAHLIEGGTRADGIPYLAMEYVEGISLDRYCEEHHLSIEDRLRLFLPLCDAVDSAHQKLIVHRDLKPSNVLVTSSGEPKLLDFGIAKALDTSTTGTQTLMLTPDFASPEQARGEQATTATDVYGLGAVLYFVLLGRAPHTHTSTSAAEISREIAESPIVRPSSLNAELRGDLENILLKALHHEPSRRYRSARDFADDIERYLAHRPVRATPDSFTYRAARFLRRHTIASIAGALAILAAAIGTSVSLYQARRAERRFAQVRELSDKFVFDFEAAIRDLPGTLPARRMVASTARQYLASLADDAKRDPSLNGELAEAYYRLSRVELSAGESANSMEHLRKTIELIKSIKGDLTASHRARYIAALADLARFEDNSGDARKAPPLAAEAVRAGRAWVAQSPDDRAAQRALASALSSEGNVLLSAVDAQKDLQEAVRIETKLLAENPTDEDIAWERARAGNWLSNVTTRLGDFPAALDQENEAKATLDGLISKHPEITRYRELRAMMSVSTASIYRKLAEKEPALHPKILESTIEAYELAKTNLRLNPGDKNLLDSAIVMTTRVGTQLNREHHPLESIPYFTEAGAMVDELLKSDPADYRNQYLFANNRALRAGGLLDLKRWNEATPLNDEALAAVNRILEHRPRDILTLDNKMNILLDRAIIEKNLQHRDVAREACSQAMKLATDIIAMDPNRKNPVSSLPQLREQAKALGVPDTTPASIH